MSKNSAFSLIVLVAYFFWLTHEAATDSSATGIGWQDVWVGALFCAGIVAGVCALICALYRTERPFVIRAFVASLAAASLIFFIRLGMAPDAVVETPHQIAITFSLPVLCCTLGAEVAVIFLAFIFNPSRSFARALI